MTWENDAILKRAHIVSIGLHNVWVANQSKISQYSALQNQYQ